MRCANCGGYVEWKGPLSNLTHTECASCGGVNCQEPEPTTEDEDDDDAVECPLCGQHGEHAHPYEDGKLR